MSRRSDTGDADALLTTAEVAALLQVHPKQIYRLLRRGMPARRLGGEWRFVRDDVLAWTGGPTPATQAERAVGESPVTAVTAPPLVAANGDVAVESLLAVLNAGGPPLFGFVQADRDRATRLLQDRAVLAAGSHGGVPPARLGGARLARLHLVTREVGLAAARGRPVPSLRDLVKVRLAARPATAGVTAHLHAALGAAGLSPRRVLAKALALDSHREVVFALLRGDADAGLTTRAWAHRMGLPFRTIASETYGLLLHADDLGDHRVVRLCESAQSAAYRSALASVPGYDATGSGDIRYDPE